MKPCWRLRATLFQILPCRRIYVDLNTCLSGRFKHGLLWLTFSNLHNKYIQMARVEKLAFQTSEGG